MWLNALRLCPLLPRSHYLVTINRTPTLMRGWLAQFEFSHMSRRNAGIEPFLKGHLDRDIFWKKKYIWENPFFSEINNRFLRIFCVHIYNTVTWHCRMMPYLSLFTTLNFHKNHSHLLYRYNQLRLVRGGVVKPLLYCSANTAFFWPISVVYVVLLINLRSPSKEVRFLLCESLLNWTWVLSSLPASSSKTPNKDRPPPLLTSPRARPQSSMIPHSVRM